MKPRAPAYLPSFGKDGATAADKHSDGAGLLRPPRICCLTILSTTFWTLIFYFHSMQRSVGPLLLKPSVFSLNAFTPSFRLGRDQCAGRYIYMYDLPPRFNADLARNYSRFLVKAGMSKQRENGGFGPPIPLGGEGGTLPETGAYDTDQFILAVIFHSRMRRYECLTSDPDAAAAVFVPFYAGFDASMNLWKTDLWARDAISRELVDWLVRRPEWRAMHGRDHFMVAARVIWDFLRERDGGWGNALMTYPAVRNTTVLTIEASPWVGSDFAVRYPPSPGFWCPGAK